jgi:hypothetical protein
MTAVADSEGMPDHYVMVGKHCVLIQGDRTVDSMFISRAFGGWRVDAQLDDGPIQVRVGTLDGARLLSGHVEQDDNGPVIHSLRVVGYRQDRLEVRVAHLGLFWVAPPTGSEWVQAEVRDLSASGAALLVPEALPVLRLRGEIHTEHGHDVAFETAGRLVRVASSEEAGLVAVYDLDLDDGHRSALRAAVLWETSAKRG